jgi:hypothetical protein
MLEHDCQSAVIVMFNDELPERLMKVSDMTEPGRIAGTCLMFSSIVHSARSGSALSCLSF